MKQLEKNKGKRGKFVKKIRRRDPYFLLNNFLFTIFSVLVCQNSFVVPSDDMTARQQGC